MRKEDKQSRPLTIKEIRDGCRGIEDEARVCFINEEIKQGIDFIQKYPNSITFFGSSRFKEDNQYYKQAQELSKTLAEKGFSIVTGGGPGIMEAANRGAKEAGGDSVGLSIQLPKEQSINPYVTDYMEFYYFFNRKVSLTFSAKAFAFFPGGFGTMDESFEILTLIQTNKIAKVPVILFGKSFWQPLIEDFLKAKLQKEHQTIDEEDLKLFKLVDSVEEACQILETELS